MWAYIVMGLLMCIIRYRVCVVLQLHQIIFKTAYFCVPVHLKLQRGSDMDTFLSVSFDNMSIGDLNVIANNVKENTCYMFISHVFLRPIYAQRTYENVSVLFKRPSVHIHIRI